MRPKICETENEACAAMAGRGVVEATTRSLLAELSETLMLVGEGAPRIAAALRHAAMRLPAAPGGPPGARPREGAPALTSGHDHAPAYGGTPAPAPARNAPGGAPALAPARDARERTPEPGHAGTFVISVEAASQMRDAFAGRVRAVEVDEPDAADAALSVTRSADRRRTNGELGAAREPAGDDRRPDRWMLTEVRPTRGTADGGAAWGRRSDDHTRAETPPSAERAPLYFSLACLPPQTSERAFKRALRAGLPVTKLGYSEIVTPSAWLAWLERTARPRVSAARAALPSTPSDDEMLASVGAKPRKR